MDTFSTAPWVDILIFAGMVLALGGALFLARQLFVDTSENLEEVSGTASPVSSEPVWGESSDFFRPKDEGGNTNTGLMGNLKNMFTRDKTAVKKPVEESNPEPVERETPKVEVKAKSEDYRREDPFAELQRKVKESTMIAEEYETSIENKVQVDSPALKRSIAGVEEAETVLDTEGLIPDVKEQGEQEAKAKKEAEEAAETARKEAEAQAQKKAKQEAKAKKEAEEAAETARKEAEAQAQKKAKQEAKAKKEAEEAAETARKEAEAQAQKKAKQEAKAKKEAEEAAETARKEAEAQAQKKAKQEAKAKKEAEEAAEIAHKEAEAQAQQKSEEEAETKRIAKEAEEAAEIARKEAEAQQKSEEEAEAKRIAKETEEAAETARKEAETQQKAEEEAEAKRIAKESEEAAEIARKEAEAQQKAEEEAEAKRIAKESEEAAEIARKEAEAQQKAEEEAEAKRLAEEARRKAEEEEARRQLEAKELRRQREEEEAKKVAEAKAERLKKLEEIPAETAEVPLGDLVEEALAQGEEDNGDWEEKDSPKKKEENKQDSVSDKLAKLLGISKPPKIEKFNQPLIQPEEEKLMDSKGSVGENLFVSDQPGRIDTSRITEDQIRRRKPRLIPDEVVILSTEQLRIALVNTGGAMVYLGHDSGTENQLKIDMMPPPIPEKGLDGPLFVKGARLTFSMQGGDVEEKGYQFKIRFQDELGVEYYQEIAGRGKDIPFITRPVKA